MSKPDLVVDFCSYQAAKYAVEHWHYSRTMPANKSNYFGAWENKKFIGVIIFGVGASPSLGKPYGLENFEFLELTRVAFCSHKNPLSKIVMIVVKKIKEIYPKIRLLISFADPFQEHIGVIYQSMNWFYTGQSSKSTAWKLSSGVIVDERRYNGHGHNKKKSVPEGAQVVKMPGKHRYLYPLDRAMRRQIEPLAKPYPKRADVGEMESR